jgi:hypothetical protein
MTQDEIKSFLANMKLVYQHGISHSKNKARLHRFLAIHNCHYVVEQIIRERAKDMTFKGGPLQKIGFEVIVRRVNKKKTIQGYNYLLQLNKTRNDAEHSNMIPDSDAVAFYTRIVGDFLRWSYKEYFGVDFESLAFEDRIYDIPIRNRMIQAKSLIEKGDFHGASLKMYEALGAFKFMWFGFLTDIRFENIKATSEPEYSLAEAFADFAFKIILSEDEATLEEFSKIKTSLMKVDDKITGVGSRYLAPLTFKDKEEANKHHENILNIILTYQDRVPNSIWRKNE